LYIKAFNPLTNVETNKLIRKPNVAAKNEYEDLILQVETLDGKIIKTMDYAWTPPAGVTLVPNPNEPYKRQTNKLGRYTVQASSANGTSCPLSIDIFADKCDSTTNTFDCGTLGAGPTLNGTLNITNLAVGDEFTIRDYTVLVTKIAGSQAAGWTGEGKLSFNFLKLANNLAIEIPISVKFDNIQVNQCYQLLNGSKVETLYDASWGSVVDVSCLLDFDKRLNSVYSDARNLYDCSTEGKARIRRFIGEVDGLFPCLEQSLDYSLAGKTVIRYSLNKLKTLANEIIDYVNDPDCDLSNANARIATGPPGSGSKKKFDAMTSIITFLGITVDDPNNQKCHTTLRGISPWTITFEEGAKDYLNSIKDGQLAHYMIEYYYKLLHPSAYTEFAIPRSSKIGNTGYADIVNPITREIFEIKSQNGETEGVVELGRYISKGNKYCHPGGAGWQNGNSFAMPDLLWPRDPTKTLKAVIKPGGIIVYSFGENRNPNLTPIFQPVPQNYLEIIKSLAKAMAVAGSISAAERLAREKLQNLPPEVKRNIILGAAAGTIAGLAVSFTGVGTAAGVTMVVASAIIVDIALEQLNNSSNAGS
jgi:hypothetical protein